MVAIPLRIGERLRADCSGVELHVIKKLGEGTQGEVYLVDGPSGFQAVKWYKTEQATAEQRAAIRYLVRARPPLRPCRETVYLAARSRHG